MLNLKKTAVAVLAFGSSAVFAGTMGPVCTPGNVTVPCASTAWDFAAQALYLRPSYSNYGYIGSVTSTDGTLETYTRAHNNWGWGFKLEGSYHFNTGNDLDLNWYHLDNSFRRHYDAVTFPAEVPGVGITTVTVADAFTREQPRWDAVNLEFGQHAHFGEWQNMRFHGGVQYAYLKTDARAAAVVSTAGGDVPATTTAIAADTTVKYSGFGPRIGADYWYNWGNGFSMYANGATALLVGTQSFNNGLAFAPAVLGVSTFATRGSTTAIVPEMELKLGATYTYAMAQGDLSLDVGWMWVNYFEAFSTGTVVGLGDTKETNFGLQGPYIGLKWIGNVA